MARTRKPVILTPELLQQVEDAAAKGITEGSIARKLFGVCQNTFIERKKAHPEIAEAIERGKARGEEFVVGKLFQAIEKGNVTAIIFFLKCQGWHDGNNKVVESITIVDSHAKDQLKEILKKKMEAA